MKMHQINRYKILEVAVLFIFSQKIFAQNIHVENDIVKKRWSATGKAMIAPTISNIGRTSLDL